MSDISGNDNIIEDSADVSENDSFAENTADTVSGDNDETIETVIYANDSIDYTSHFENIETIGIFICGLLVAYGIAFAFFKGFKK